MNITDRLFEFFDLHNIKPTALEKEIGIANGYFQKMKGRSGFVGSEVLEKIFRRYPNVDLGYIITGNKVDNIPSNKMYTSMYTTMCTLDEKQNETTQEKYTFENNFENDSTLNEPQSSYSSKKSKDVEYFENEALYFDVPEFKAADYLIRATGASMQPKFKNGDLLACKKIKNASYIEWGRIYVIDATHGAMVKRLHKSVLKHHYACISDNPAYEPFDIPIKDVKAIALVIGCITIE